MCITLWGPCIKSYYSLLRYKGRHAAKTTDKSEVNNVHLEAFNCKLMFNLPQRIA